MLHFRLLCAIAILHRIECTDLSKRIIMKIRFTKSVFICFTNTPNRQNNKFTNLIKMIVIYINFNFKFIVLINLNLFLYNQVQFLC